MLAIGGSLVNCGSWRLRAVKIGLQFAETAMETLDLENLLSNKDRKPGLGRAVN